MNARLGFSAAALCAFTASAHADVLISTDPTQNMTCSGGVCSPTAADAVLNVNDLANMLATGDTKVTTGSGAVNIDVVAALSWSSTSRLTLDANTGLNVQAPVTVAGSGALTLTYNDGGSNGDLIFSSGGNATFANLSSSLVINGSSYKLSPDLTTLARAMNKNRDTHFALSANYDASLHGTYKKSPINIYFSGVFEGLGHSVANLTIADDSDTDDCVGLFKVITGTVRDISLTAVKMSSTRAVGLGALAGCGSGDLVHVSVDGVVQGIGTGFFGGVIGLLQTPGSASFVTSAVNVTNPGFASEVGGLAGGATGRIIHSRATGSVAGGERSAIGGLVGENTAQVSYSSATGAVTGTQTNVASYTGGLAGASGAPITQSYTTGSVTGDGDTLGGLVGSVGDAIDNSYATGAVTGHSGPIGGLVGSANNITNSYSTGPVSLDQNGASTPSKPYVGGFIGYAGADLKKDYWDTDTAGTEFGCGKNRRCKPVEGVSDAQLKSGLPAGFDPNIWGQNANINDGYPYLLANPPQ